jgi:hypothetical protein
MVFFPTRSCSLSFFVPADRRKVIKERWRDFFANPSQWWDHRLEKVKQKIVAVIRIAFVFAQIPFYIILSLAFVSQFSGINPCRMHCVACCIADVPDLLCLWCAERKIQGILILQTRRQKMHSGSTVMQILPGW